MGLADILCKDRKMSGSLLKSKSILRRGLYVVTYRNVTEMVITHCFTNNGCDKGSNL